MGFETEQELFWCGEFGDQYAQRNRGEKWVASNTGLFAEIFKHAGSIASIIEFGANIGLNMSAIDRLLPHAELSAIEINQQAADELQQNVPRINVHQTSILEFAPSQSYDFVFTKGVLIHIAPPRLNEVYDKMFDASSRYVMVAEYYNPAPVEIPYQGHAGKLFKRDFAGEMLDRFPALQLINYGFAYHRDPVYPQDDVTWFLMEKRN